MIGLTALPECKTGKRNSQLEHGKPMEQKRRVLHVRLGCGSPRSITTQLSLVANLFDVRSVLHGQVGLAAANPIRVIHEAMNGCKNLKIH